MAEIIERPDPSWFRFDTWDLDSFCDGRWHSLRAGVDLPEGIDLESIRARLRNAASDRRCHATTRIVDPGTVVFRFTKKRF